jgi:hypothetical protein
LSGGADAQPPRKAVRERLLDHVARGIAKAGSTLDPRANGRARAP